MERKPDCNYSKRVNSSALMKMNRLLSRLLDTITQFVCRHRSHFARISLLGADFCRAYGFPYSIVRKARWMCNSVEWEIAKKLKLY